MEEKKIRDANQIAAMIMSHWDEIISELGSIFFMTFCLARYLVCMKHPYGHSILDYFAQKKLP